MRTASRVPGLEVGLSGVCSAVVGPADTCRVGRHRRSGRAGNAESAGNAGMRGARRARRPARPELTTVGVRVQLEHLLPIGIGESISATASLLTVRGRRITLRGAARRQRGARRSGWGG